MNIREAKLTDAAAIARVSVSSIRSTYPGIFPRDFLDSLTVEAYTVRWQDRLNDPDPLKFTLIAETPEGEVVGYAGGLPERTENRVYTGELGDIYILADYQRMGIGRVLMSAVVQRLQKMGHSSLLVWAVSTNPSCAFYESLGGVPVDTKDEFRAGVLIPETAYGWRDLSVFSGIPEI